MSTLSLRLPDSLHETARTLAREEHVSVNQLISTAVAEKISALMTETYLLKRGRFQFRYCYRTSQKSGGPLIGF